MSRLEGVTIREVESRSPNFLWASTQPWSD